MKTLLVLLIVLITLYVAYTIIKQLIKYNKKTSPKKKNISPQNLFTAMEENRRRISDSNLEEIAVDSVEGLNERFYKNGKIKERFHIKNGKREGLHQLYYEDGQLMCEQTYKKGLVHGTVSAWYADGNKLSLVEVKKGEMTGSYQFWWPNGQLYARGSHIKDRRHGLCEAYYENGQLQSRGNWNHSFEVYDGVGGIWHENGKKAQEDILIDGEIICKQYDKKGKLKREINYTSGEFLYNLMNVTDEKAIIRLLTIILWIETEELGEDAESILDEIGYVSPIPKSEDVIKLIGPKDPYLVESFKLALKFNKKK